MSRKRRDREYLADLAEAVQRIDPRYFREDGHINAEPEVNPDFPEHAFK